MKRSQIRGDLPFLIAFILISISVAGIHPQTPDAALKYMDPMQKIVETISNDMWSYMKVFAHIENPSLIANRQSAMIHSVEQSIQKIKKIGPFQGDSSYRDAALKYMETLDRVLRKDYANLVDMEEIAEQSYDAMEAFLLAREKANEKLNQAAEELNKSEKEFAAKNRINLVYQESEIGSKLKKSADVFEYYNNIYLIFFKSHKQEMYLLDALDKGDLNRLEQNRLTLNKYSEEGLKRISSAKPYEKDDTLRTSCKEFLEFARDESKDKIPLLIDFLMKKENFEKIKRAFDLKKPEERTKEDVDLYNGKVEELNGAGRFVNQIIEELNQKRSILIRRWNHNVKAFLDIHIPE
jgi:hypothetical protein